METRKGKVTELHEEHDGWRFEVEVLTPAWKVNHAEIILPGEEIDLDLLFLEKGDPQKEESYSLPGSMKEEPPFAVGDEVTVRFT